VSGGPDPRAFAELLCGYCLEVGEGRQVLVRSTTLAEPLLLEVQRAVLARGAWPLLRAELPGAEEGFYAAAGAAQLDAEPSAALTEAREVDAFLTVQAPANTRALAGVDPALIARHMRAGSELREVRMARRWCGTLWPTQANAQQAGMSLGEFAAFVRRAPSSASRARCR
jgi:aminopeptidase